MCEVPSDAGTNDPRRGRIDLDMLHNIVKIGKTTKMTIIVIFEILEVDFKLRSSPTLHPL